jgi:hypothetical protein
MMFLGMLALHIVLPIFKAPMSNLFESLKWLCLVCLSVASSAVEGLVSGDDVCTTAAGWKSACLEMVVVYALLMIPLMAALGYTVSSSCIANLSGRSTEPDEDAFRTHREYTLQGDTGDLEDELDNE